MHGGELIFQTTDQYGSIEVIDYQQKIRSLHFGNATQQSAMLLGHPHLLIHKYAQAMMLPISWKSPDNVLVLGLGSGAIVNFLHNSLQDTHIDAVELRSEIISIAEDYFELNIESERINIIKASADDWLISNDEQKEYDLIIVDLFLTNNKGNDITIDISGFQNKLIKLLSEDGTICFNQLGTNAFSYPGLEQMLTHFYPQNLYTVDIDGINTIIYATTLNTINSDEHLYELEKNLTCPFKQYSDRLKGLFS